LYSLMRCCTTGSISLSCVSANSIISVTVYLTSLYKNKASRYLNLFEVRYLQVVVVIYLLLCLKLHGDTNDGKSTGGWFFTSVLLPSLPCTFILRNVQPVDKFIISPYLRSQLIRATRHPPCTASAHGVYSLSTS
jgi:hypothetical protein